MVWMFPLTPVSGAVPAIEKTQFEQNQRQRARKARALSDEELLKRAAAAPTVPGERYTTTRSYERDPYVSEAAKRRANGVCQLCETPAPFRTKAGGPYLETHHLVWLSSGGADSLENTVALCPNCHRKMHVVNAAVDRLKLSKAVGAFQLLAQAKHAVSETAVVGTLPSD